MSPTLIQIFVASALALLVLLSLGLAALHKPTESETDRAERKKRLENFKKELKEDLKCLKNLTSREKEIVEETKREEKRSGITLPKKLY